jgi:pyroglutamyl-peptidase
VRVLFSAFGPFPGVEVNPSPLVARRAQTLLAERRPGLSTRLVELPTHFGGAWEVLSEVLEQERQTQPLVMVAALGVSGRADRLTLERTAVNFRRGGRPDAAGAALEDGEVLPQGPAQLLTRLPVAALVERLTQEGFMTKTSDDAGAYVCNEIFYRLLHWAQSSGWGGVASFFHVPHVPATRALDEVAAPLARLIDLTLDQKGAGAPSS